MGMANKTEAANESSPHDEFRYYCIDCRGTINPHDKVCPHCGADTSKFVEEEEGSSERTDDPILTRKYPALRFIAALYQVIAVVIAVLTLLGLVVSFQQSASTPIITIVSLVVGLIGVVSFVALSESIKVFIDIEQNTRTTVELLRVHQSDEDD